MVRYSFPVSLFHRRLYAGLSRRTRILRPVVVSINRSAGIPKRNLLRQSLARYNYSCPGSAPLAGFEVSAYGRFSDVHRGAVTKTDDSEAELGGRDGSNFACRRTPCRSAFDG
jgi:hypothetical protein